MKTLLPIIAVTALLDASCSKNPSSTAANDNKVAAAATTTSAKGPTFSDFPAPPKPEVTPELLARGKAVYAQNCVACHGENGDGKGPASAFLAPHPRDFVKANYRLRTTAPNSLPTDVDLFREISLGMPGTPMPPWKHMLSDNDRWALVEYVKSFSPRFKDSTEQIIAVGDLGTPPQKTPAAVAEGKELYTRFACLACHGQQGQGDGPAAVALLDDSNSKIKPRNFSNPSLFKGGYSTREIARTILSGFNGTPMVGFNATMKKEEAWKLAYFVESFGKPASASPLLNPESQNFLAREELGAPDVKVKLTERAWHYHPEVIRVNKGQVVEITFEPTDNGLGVGHGLGISGYDENVFINGAMVGVPKTAKFRADHAGTFTFYCSTQCSTEKLHPLMHGTLIVEDTNAPKETALNQ